MPKLENHSGKKPIAALAVFFRASGAPASVHLLAQNGAINGRAA
jgi:hypothetical protein